MDSTFQQPLGELLALRRFSGAPKEFWQRFLAASAQLAQAEVMVLVMRSPGTPPRWSKLGEWSAGTGQPRLRAAFFAQLESMAERCLASDSAGNEGKGGSEGNGESAANKSEGKGANKPGSFIQELDEAAGAFTVALQLKTNQSAEQVFLIGLLGDFTETAAGESLVRLALAADTPELYQNHLSIRQATADVAKFATVLDLMVPINAEKHFLSAAMALCNGIASSLKCDRVSLGWLEGGYIKLKAISRTESFNNKMAAAQALEAAMEECLDQDEEILLPASSDATTITRDHEKFAREQQSTHLCSLPLRVEDKPVAVLLCERSGAAFTAAEVPQLRLCCDQAVRRLADLKQTDRWFGARWKSKLQDLFSMLFSPEHTLAKALGLLVFGALLALFLIRVEYRVEGTFMLRSDKVSFLTAPFDGYIEEVSVRPGDHLHGGGQLLSLDRSELLLEESAAKADLSRFQRESEKARASKSLAEMKIADALAEQARCKLDMIRYRLDNAVIKTPFDGVVVEGDLRERIAAPVKQGDALYKVARTDALYIEAGIDERDVRRISESSKAEVAFVTQPKLKFPAKVEVIQPAAVTKKEGNQFLVRLQFQGDLQPWWRPGMTGLCKISAGPRTLFWILTHRTVDFLRLKLWW